MSIQEGVPKRWVVGITDYVTAPAQIEEEAFPEAQFRFLSDWRSSPQARQEWAQVDALLIWHWKMDPETAAILDRCKIAVRYGVGFDLVNVGALAARGIPFCNTPDYGTEEVADTACALILTLQRKILAYDQASRWFTHGWQENLLRPHLRTSEVTVGLMGVGRIGTAVANRLKPFRFQILGFDPYQPSGHEKAVGYERTETVEELLERSKILSIHCPLTEETRGRVNEAFLRKMPPGGLLVNTARGKIMDGLDGLEKVLRDGHLAGAGLDVLPDEPPQDHPLIRAWRRNEPWLRGRLIINPHAAYYSDRGWYEMRYKAAQTARMFLLQGKLRNRIG